MPRQSQRTNRTRTERKKSGPNRQQIRAAEIRAAQTHEDVFAASTPLFDEPEETDESLPRQRSGIRTGTLRTRTRANRSAVAVRKLTREQEYGFIKADLRRLLITAGSLAVVMIVVLFIVEG